MELSARYMMSDFETVIKESFISHFPDVEAKGCAFHFAAAIIKKVSRNGFRGQYSDPKCAAFRGFIRRMTGIVNVPPLRLKEAIRNLYIMADELTGRQRSFSYEEEKKNIKIKIKMTKDQTQAHSLNEVHKICEEVMKKEKEEVCEFYED